VSKQFSCIENLSAAGSQNCITGLGFASKTLKIDFTAIKSKICSGERKTKGLKIATELVSQGLRGH
jgi:hypothetical protein